MSDEEQGQVQERGLAIVPPAEIQQTDDPEIEKVTFESLFALREQAIRDPFLRTLYMVIVARLREDAQARPTFGTIESLMLERVAFQYVLLRDREQMGIGPVGTDDPPPGFANEKIHRETSAMWYDMASKFQRAEAKEPIDDDFLKDQFLADVGVAVGNVVDEMLELADAKAVKAKIVEEFEKLDI